MNLLYLNFPEVKNSVIFISVYLPPSYHMLMEMQKQCPPFTKVDIFGEGYISLASSTEKFSDDYLRL